METAEARIATEEAMDACGLGSFWIVWRKGGCGTWIGEKLW